MLAREHAWHLTLRRMPGDRSCWLVEAGQVCGVIPLPSGRRVYIEPKAPIGNIWHLLAYAADLPRVHDSLVECDGVAGLLDGLMAVYVRELCGLIDRGLARGYRRRLDTLSHIRGRLDVSEQLRANPGIRHRFACAYDEFTIDTAQNRALLAALHVVRRAHGPVVGLGPRVEHCLRALAGVRDEPPKRCDPALLRPPPASPHYATPLALAGLLLACTGPGHRPGSRRAPAMLVKMPRLFERFVCRALERGLRPPLSVRTSGQSLALDRDGRAVLTPDAVVERGGRAVCVVDAKYKTAGDAGADTAQPASDDLYQMLAYCVGYRASHAVLVYPCSGRPAPLHIARPPWEAHVHLLCLDLSGDQDAVREQCALLARRLTEMANGGEARSHAAVASSPTDACPALR